jgi:hypothetical protein
VRGSKAKRLRRADPTRPNPGRKNGGTEKLRRRLLALAARVEALTKDVAT